MNTNLVILVLSIAVQAVNVFLAARLMRRTGNYLTGAVVISAVFLMAFRRGSALSRYLSGGEFMTELTAESLALVISCLFPTGILYATRLIESEMLTCREAEKDKDDPRRDRP